MDEWSDLLFTASYSGIELDIVSTSDDVSRVLARHEYPFRDGAVLQDMGAAPRSTQCRIIFMPTSAQAADDNHISRVSDFLQIVSDAHALDRPPNFIHPISGSYPALVEGLSFDATANERDFIVVNCTFVEAGLDPAAFTASGDESIETGVAEVDFARTGLSTALAGADEGLGEAVAANPVTVHDDALTTAEGWAATPGITPRQVNLEMNEITNEINDEVDRLEVITRVDRYPTFLAFQRLHAAVRRAAELAIATGPTLTEHRVLRTEPLLALVTEIYGGTLAVDQYTRTRELNDIPNPGRIEAGTVLTIETP
jgi:hypothetical protein